MVNEIIQYQSKENLITVNPDIAIENFNKAIAKGIIKIVPQGTRCKSFQMNRECEKKIITVE